MRTIHIEPSYERLCYCILTQREFINGRGVPLWLLNFKFLLWSLLCLIHRISRKPFHFETKLESLWKLLFATTEIDVFPYQLIYLVGSCCMSWKVFSQSSPNCRKLEALLSTSSVLLGSRLKHRSIHILPWGFY